LSAYPLLSKPLCPDTVMLAGLSGGVAPCPVAALVERHDDANLICLTRQRVNNPKLAMQSERGVVL